MKIPTALHNTGLVAIASIAMLAAQGTALARGGGGGGGGGGHAAFGGGHFGGGGFARGGLRGGYAGRGGYGWRGYGRGGYGYYRGWGGWGWGGLGYGLFLSTLPFYYSTLWWDGVPYYYANDDYYEWNGDVDEYEQVQPPPQVVQEAGAQGPTVKELFAYPMKGQTAQQQSADKNECRTWAMRQTGVNPAQSTTGTPARAASKAPANSPTTSSAPPPAASGELLGEVNGASAPVSAAAHGDYLRAEAACLKARGYSVE